jgi:hypothetical protein
MRRSCALFARGALHRPPPVATCVLRGRCFFRSSMPQPRKNSPSGIDARTNRRNSGEVFHRHSGARENRGSRLVPSIDRLSELTELSVCSEFLWPPPPGPRSRSSRPSRRKKLRAISSVIETAYTVASFNRRVQDIGIAEVLTAPRSPWQNQANGDATRVSFFRHSSTPLPEAGKSG